MQYAIDNEKTRIFIGNAITGEHYFCPCCGSKVIQRKGQIRIPHFAHEKGSACSDNWHYDEMSEWHREWQAQYPAECQEVIIEKDGIKHRADVCINRTVIEFQHSPINSESFLARNDFYTAAGYKLIWLFDDAESEGKTTDNLNVHIYSQSENEITDLTGNEHYTKEEFIALTSDNKLGTPKLSYKLQLTRNASNELVCYSCPIANSVDLNKTERRNSTCEGCEFCQSIDLLNVRCNERFKDYDIDFIQEWKDDQLTYIDHNGECHKVTIDPPKPVGKPIIVLIYENTGKILYVRNLTSNHVFRIPKGSIEDFSKYNGKLYGYMQKEDGSFYLSSKEVKFCNNADWVIEKITE